MEQRNVNERFSIFPCGWWNEAKQEASPQQRPQQTQTIEWVYEYIISERARKPTEELRAMLPTATKEQCGKFKVLNFEYATFSGIFSYRNANCLGARSPYICLDIDGLGSGGEARDVQHALCADKYVETELCFVSPSGNGWCACRRPWRVCVSATNGTRCAITLPSTTASWPTPRVRTSRVRASCLGTMNVSLTVNIIFNLSKNFNLCLVTII